MKTLRQRLFGYPDGRSLSKVEITVGSLRDVLRTVRKEKRLIILDRPIAQNDLTATRYGDDRSQYLSLDGVGTPYALFIEALSKMRGASVPVGTTWKHGQRRLFIPFEAQVNGALQWWYDQHKYPREERRMLEKRLREEVRKLPLDSVVNEAVNGASYHVVVPNRQAGKNAYHMTLYGIPVVAGGAWQQLRWEQKTTHAQLLDAAQLAGGEEQHAITAEAIAALYKIAFVASLDGNNVPKASLPLLRPTRRLLKLDAALRRVRVKREYGVRTLRGNERSRLFGAALRQERKPFYLFHEKHNIEAIPREEMERFYSSSGL